MIYEMLIGIVSRSSPLVVLPSDLDTLPQTPFWASNHTDMYTRVLHDDLVFPEERPVDQDTKSLIRGVSLHPLSSVSEDDADLVCRFQLLQRNPALRLSEPRIKKHPFVCLAPVSVTPSS